MKLIKSKREYYLVYTVLFCVILASILVWYMNAGKALFREIDGTDQNYLSFVYTGKWFRSIFRNIFIRHKLVIPLWDGAIGYGEDIPTLMHVYIANPINWIAAFVPSRYGTIAFEAALCIQIYLSGITFSVYAFYSRRNEYMAVLSGCLIYTFSAGIFIGFTQQAMIIPFYLFPLVMTGVEKIWNGENPYFYIASLTATLMIMYYFAYMMLVLIIFRCLLHFFIENSQKKSLRTFGKTVIRYVWPTLLSLGLSMVMFLPILFVLRGNTRLSINYSLSLFYDRGFNESLLSGFMVPHWMGPLDCIIGFSALAFPLVIALFTFRRKHTLLKWEIVLMTVGLFMPYFGHLMNGMSYAANRWVWAYCLAIGLACTDVIGEWDHFTRYTVIVPFIALGVYFAAVRIGFHHVEAAFWLQAVIACVCWLIVAALYIRRNGGAAVIRTVSGSTVVCLTVMTCMVVTCLYFCPSIDGDMVMQSPDQGGIYERVTEGGGLFLLKGYDTSDGSRYDKDTSTVRNASWLIGKSGMNFYMDSYNPYTISYMNHMAILSGGSLGDYAGQDRRTELESLMGVNAFVSSDPSETLPYGYTEKISGGTGSDGNAYALYSMNGRNSLMYWFDSYATRDEYDRMTPYGRQQLLMKACVVEDGTETSGTEHYSGELPDDELTYRLNIGDNIEVGKEGTSGRKIVVSQDGSSVTVSFPAVKGSELYAGFQDLVMDDSDGSSDFGISIQAMNDGQNVDDMHSYFYGLTPNDHMYGGKKDWLSNVGYADQEVDSIMITFEKAGTYHLGSFRVYAKPHEEIDASVENLQRHAISTVKEEKYLNRYEADVEATEDGYVFIAVPYSEGWSALVDGEKAEVLRADDGFMALKLSPGTHHIMLKYITPGLLPGLLISVICLLILIVIRRFPGTRKKASITEN